jgi:hypothetical protein
MAGEHQDACGGARCGDLFDSLDAVHLRHQQIHQDDVWHVLKGQCHRPRSLVRLRTVTLAEVSRNLLKPWRTTGWSSAMSTRGGSDMGLTLTSISGTRQEGHDPGVPHRALVSLIP